MTVTPLTFPRSGEESEVEEDQIERKGFGRRESDWQRPGFWLSVMGFLLTIALVLLAAIWNKLDTMSTAMTQYAVEMKGADKDIQALQEFKREQKDHDSLMDTYNSDTRERTIRIQQKMEDYGIIKSGELGPPLTKNK